MTSRVITDSETDATATLIFSGDLLEIDSPGSLQTPNIIALNGADFEMTAGATLTATGVADPDPANGLDALSLNGMASINDAVLNAAGNIAIGNSGDAAPASTGGLTVSNGATVTAADTAIGNWDAGGQDIGLLALEGAGTTWQDNGDPAVSVSYGAMEVGARGIGHLLIQSGATATETAFAVIGGGIATAKGDAIVDGVGSDWDIGTHLRVGAFGTGSLSVSNKATVSVGDYAAIGYFTGGSGTVTIDSSATFSVTGTLFVGHDGSGTLSVKNGGTVTAAEVDIAYATGSKGTIVADGGTLTSSGQILVGDSSPASLALHKAAQVKGTDVTIGANSGTDAQSTTVVDGSSTLTATGTLFVGLNGPGTLGISGNGTVTADLLAIALGATGGTEALNSGVTIDGAGSLLKIKTEAFVDGANPDPNTPDFTNGEFGRWQYSDSGLGGIQVVNGGFLSIGHLLELQESVDGAAPESLRVRSGGGAEIGGNSTLVPDTLTIDSGGVLAGHGRVIVADGSVPDLVNHSLVNNGFLLAQNGTLTIDANVTGTGTLQIDQDAAADVDGDFSGNVLFNGAYDTTLRLEQPDPSHFKGTLDNLQIGDVISLRHSALPGDGTLSHTEIVGSNLYLTFKDGTSWRYALSGDYAGDTFTSHTRFTDNSILYDELVLEPANPQIEAGPEVSGQPSGGTSPYVDALTWGWGQWRPGSGPITYWFGGPDDVKPAVLAHGESTLLGPDTEVDTWTGDEQATFQSALATYASVSSLTFLPASSADTADLIWWLEPGLAATVGLLGLSELPAEVSGGSLWQFFDDADWLTDPNRLQFGGIGLETAVHEIGHSLGLAHPSDGGDEPDGTTFPLGSSDPQNQTVFTTMSDKEGWNGSLAPATPDHGTQGGLGALDIAAIQALYGQNTTTGAGDTTYLLPTANQVGTGWQAIWDPNGFNTISDAGITASCVIDLRAAPLVGPNAGGFPSYVIGVQGGLTIANGTEIDGAIGGTQNDLIYTNDGPDLIEGGGGLDTVVFSQPLSDYVLNRAGTTITVNDGSVIDTLVDINLLRFSDQDVRVSNIACFAEGTCIVTDHGEVAVESLQAGDQVLALTGGTYAPLTVTWIGHRQIDLTRHPEPDSVQPIRIRRDAIAPGQPARDLCVSPDHAIFIDGGLIPAKLLVNGGSVVQEHAWTSVTYYHVELRRHAIILAEGLPAESYLDTGNRRAFENADGPLMLHPDFSQVTRETGSCAPLIATPALVQPIWDRLARRAVDIGFPAALPEATSDPALILLVNGRTLRPVLATPDRYVFVVPSDAAAVRLVSRAARPGETRPWVDDIRRLGVRIGRIMVTDNGDLTDVALDSPSLTEGWWAVEVEGRSLSRWTDGDACLLLPVSPGAGRVLTLSLAGSTTYPARATRDMIPARKVA